MLQSRWGLPALVLAIALAFACVATQLAPRFVATGGVLMPAGMLRAQYAAPDPLSAAALAGFAVAFLALFLPLRGRARAVRSEDELIATLGVPLLAARPLAPQVLSEQLKAYWFGRGRPVLAVVSAKSGDGCTLVAAELARALAASGEPTLVIDADFRSPALHRAFGLRNRDGLADFLEGRNTQLAHCAGNLSVLVAGRTGADPLELLSRQRMQDLLAAAAKRYRVVLVATPAAACGPDLQLSAAFAGGALVVVERGSEVTALTRLRDLLASCRAQVVGTVLTPAAS